MALRSLTMGTWGPATCALRCRRSGASMPAAAPSRFVATIRNQQVKQHNNGTRKETSDEKAILMNELDKVFEALSQRDKDLENLQGEVRRVVKIFAVSWVGICSYSLFRALPINNLHCP
ncbi:unnamed protein product [Urochloa humidicola]